MFTTSVIEQLNYYVYLLRDPASQDIFYVGKGRGNRVFDHVRCAIEINTNNNDDAVSLKYDRIRKILDQGNEVEHLILRHGLDEKTAFEVEASVIDLLDLGNLTNLQIGHYSDDFGLKTTDEIAAMYSAKPLETELSVILININKLFNRTMTAEELYEATRKSWVLGDRRNKAEYAIPTYRGLTREVYKITNWFPVGSRWGFDGVVADEEIRNKLRLKSIAERVRPGAANPIRYINCH